MGKNIVAVVYVLNNSSRHFFLPLLIIIIYLSIAGVFILMLIMRLYISDNEKEQQVQTLSDYTNIISSAGFGIWHIYIKDGSLPRMQVNEKMAELLSINPKNLTEEQIYSSWFNNVTPEAIESVNESVSEMIRGKFSENTYQWNHPLKGKIYVRCGGTSKKLSDGTIVLRGYHADVTELVAKEQNYNEELKLARKNAEVANAAKTNFLFNMSHDIRTPMNAILGYTDLLEKYHADPGKCYSYMAKIRSSSDFLLSLINNVLEMARIDSGKMILTEKPFSAGIILEELSSVYSELMKKKNIKFVRISEIKTKYIYGDIVKIKEIFLNILSNAYKYTPEGKSITIKTIELPSEKSGYAVLQTTFSDTGIGMSKEYLPTIFEEFSREKSVTETGIEGSGLGMPIVKKLIDIMGGTIEVESELGKGSVFTITLTHKIADESEVETEKSESTEVYDFKGKRILLVEDNEFNAEIAIEILEDAGFTIERAEDGVICLDMFSKAKANYYDLILMDVQMPNMNGYEATKKIRSLDDKEKANIPIIAMTANAFETDKKNAFAAGMNGHVGKPIKVSELLKTISENLK